MDLKSANLLTVTADRIARVLKISGGTQDVKLYILTHSFPYGFLIFSRDRERVHWERMD